MNNEFAVEEEIEDDVSCFGTAGFGPIGRDTDFGCAPYIKLRRGNILDTYRHTRIYSITRTGSKRRLYKSGNGFEVFPGSKVSLVKNLQAVLKKVERVCMILSSKDTPCPLPKAVLYH